MALTWIDNPYAGINITLQEMEMEREDGSKYIVAFVLPVFATPQSRQDPGVDNRISGTVAVASPSTVTLNRVVGGGSANWNGGTVAVASNSTATLNQVVGGGSVTSTTTSTSEANPKGTGLKCFNCPKEFATRYMLKRHEVIHVGGNNLCTEPGCGTNFRNETTLTKHRVKVHGLVLRPRRPTTPGTNARGQIRKRAQGKRNNKKAKRDVPLVTLSPEPDEEDYEEEEEEEEEENDTEEGEEEEEEEEEEEGCGEVNSDSGSGSGVSSDAGSGSGMPSDSGSGSGMPSDSGSGSGMPLDSGSGIGMPLDSGSGSGMPSESGSGSGMPSDSGSGSGMPSDSVSGSAVVSGEWSRNEVTYDSFDNCVNFQEGLLGDGVYDLDGEMSTWDLFEDLQF